MTDNVKARVTNTNIHAPVIGKDAKINGWNTIEIKGR